MNLNTKMINSDPDDKDLLWIERYPASLYLNHRGFEVVDDYTFHFEDRDGTKTAYIRHFGLIDIEEEIYTFIDFLDRYLKQKRTTIVNDVRKRLGLVRNRKSKKIDTLPHLNGYQSSIADLEDEEAYRGKRCRYRILKLLSDAPSNASPESFPYRIVNDGVVLHDVYAPLFKNGEIPIMTKNEADMLLRADIGFDKERGCPVKIKRLINNTVQIDIYLPTGEIVTVDCFDYSTIKNI